MKIFSSLVVLFVLFSCSNSKEITTSLVPKPDTEAAIDVKGESQLAGTVTTEQKEAIPGATVMLIQNDKHVLNVVTDLEGNYFMDKILSGRYDVEVNARGFESVLKTNNKIEESASINFTMKASKEPIIVPLKPIIYLYPKQKMDISVELNYKGELAHTYPIYPEDGWKVTAHPDGTLLDKNGKEYYALFWEGKPTNQILPKDGFVIKGEETVQFLEEKLAFLGLNRREANEFIMFWLPQMENNPYNLIHFSSEDYEELAELKVSPKPETIIRVMMLLQPLEEKIDFPLQDISALKKVRKGFTLVEWGGSFCHGIVN